MTNAVIGIGTLFTLVLVNSLITFHSDKFEKIISGSPTVLVAHGELQNKVMDKERVSEGEIFDQIHKSGLEELDQVKWAILESDGRISIIPKDEYNAVAQVREGETPVK